LIKGRWGSGKTYLVNQFFDRKLIKPLYVSLYGMREISEIEDAFFRQLHPMLASKGMKIAAAVAKGLLKSTVKIDFDKIGAASPSAEAHVPDISLPKFLSNAKGRLLVFDDLERVEMPIKNILGYINSFVEHDESKVIIIANEDDIIQGEEGKTYQDTKEKVIGKVFEVKAEFTDALLTFARDIKNDDVRKLYEHRQKEIEAIFRQSEKNNLRILQQTMWDFERFALAAEPRHRGSFDAMSAVLGPFFALSFEMKANRLRPEDVAAIDGPDWGRLLRKDKSEGPRSLLEKRYPEVDFDKSIVGSRVLRDALFNSVLDGATIRDLLNRSPFFAEPADEPPWRALWFATSRTDEQAEKAMLAVEGQFKARSFEEAGEILHVCGLRLWLSRIGALRASREQVVVESKVYIDDMYNAHRLKASSTTANLLRGIDQSYQGLGYFERECGEFNEIFEYLLDKEKQVVIDGYPDAARVLLGEMQSDTDTFLQRIIISNRAENVFGTIPILRYLQSEEFVKSLLAMPRENQHTALMAFGTRYQALGVAPELRSELPWLEETQRLLLAHASTLPAIGRYGLEGMVQRYLTAAINLLRTGSSETSAVT